MEQRKKKVINFDTNVNFRISKEILDKFKKCCEELPIKNTYQSVIRMLMQEFIDRTESEKDKKCTKD